MTETLIGRKVRDSSGSGETGTIVGFEAFRGMPVVRWDNGGGTEATLDFHLLDAS